MEQIISSQSASTRSLLYWLLADLFLKCPDNQSVGRLRHDLTSVPDGPGPLGRLNKLCDVLPVDSAGVDELAVEYTRLFGALSPREAPRPPYESVHRLPDATQAVERFYDETGLVPREACTPSDHIGMELRFLALLCHREAEALGACQQPDADNCARRQQAFLDRHLLAWAPQYLDALITEARHPFYRALANVTRATLADGP